MMSAFRALVLVALAGFAVVVSARRVSEALEYSAVVNARAVILSTMIHNGFRPTPEEALPSLPQRKVAFDR